MSSCGTARQEKRYVDRIVFVNGRVVVEPFAAVEVSEETERALLSQSVGLGLR